MLPEEIKQLAAKLTGLPGIGPRQAIRLALHLAQDKDSTQEFLKNLGDLDAVRICSLCYLPHTSPEKHCQICSDTNRDQKTLAIVEKVTDLLSLEQSQGYKGLYLILGPLSKDASFSDEQKRRLDSLKKRNDFKEILIALSPTRYGDLSASALEAELKGLTKKITRLGRGIPTGADIEFADEQTLGEALKNRS